MRRAVGILAALAGVGTPVGAAELPLETAVKANYLYKFAPFVQWPAAAFAGPRDPLVICVAGPNPFGAALEEVTRGQRVDGRPIVVRHVDSFRGGACHILFAGPGEASEAVLREAAHQPVLTVTDRTAGPAGGIIQFVTVGGRVRFAIDQAAAAGTGIAISSKLLSLAVGVTR